ncbi:MAG: hypothetical protein AB2556_26365, partial [Candidatus Thiodiazotropha sp.]
ENGPSASILSVGSFAAQTFKVVDTAIRGQDLDPIGPEPQLFDFYAPSYAQNDHRLAYTVIGIVVIGLLAYKLTE